MDLGIQGKKAVVCAASKGIGRACALALSREGAHVAICARETVELERTAAMIRAETGNEVVALPADLTQADQIDAFFDEVVGAFGTVHILVNNTGGPRPSKFADTPDEEWAATFDLLFLSAIRCVRRVLPLMEAEGWGRIIQLASYSVKQPIDNLVQSNAVRTGAVAMLKTLARETGRPGITVNSVCPGYIRTDRGVGVIQRQADLAGVSWEEAAAAITSDVPAARLGEPEEVAAVVAFLASQQAAYIHGTTIQVDGGLVRGLL